MTGRMSLKLIFMGTPDFAATALAALHQSGQHIVAVYTQPPAQSGRGMRRTPCATQKLAESYGLPVHSPPSLKDPDSFKKFAAYQPDLVIVAAYGQILPQNYLTAPRLGCWNIHASLLPRWRGAAPIQRALMAGDKQTGISIMQMDAGLDTGDILLTRICPILADDNAQSLANKLANLGGQAIIEALAPAQEAALSAQPQAATGITYAEKLSKSESRIDWSHSAQHLHNHIRALSPAPCAWTQIAGARVKILAAKIVATDMPAVAGKVLAAADGDLCIACGTDALRLTWVQKAGKKPMDAAAYLRGVKLKKGDIL